MRADLLTLFTGFFAGPLDFGVLRRARAAGIVEVHTHDLRTYTHDRHRTVDDRPFGGGEGMLLKCEPLFEAAEAIGVTPKGVRAATETRHSALAAGADVYADGGSRAGGM